MVLIEKWKKSVDNGGVFGALLTDLSKAFDCLNHELLIAKLHAYGFDFNSLKLIYKYLANRNERVKSMILLVPGVRFHLEFLKDQF